MTKPIDAVEIVEVYRVICPKCNQKFWEPHEGYTKCPLCDGDVHGAAYVSNGPMLVYPVLIDPLTGAASLGPPSHYKPEEAEDIG